MAALRDVEWEPCLLERTPDREFERRFERATGRPGGFIQYFVPCPWLADAILRLSVQEATHVHLDAQLGDLVGLVVSQDNSCRFCFGMQRAFLRVLGMSEQRLARLEQDQITADFTPRERAALDFARRLSRSRPLLAAADLEALRRAGFAAVEIRELIGRTAVYLFFNRVSTLAALPPTAIEQLPDRWWVRLVRPLLARYLLRMRHAAGAARLPEADRRGPYAWLVNAFDGLPLAHELRVVLDGMWAAGPLPPRTVSLVVAVIARALGAHACEAEARRLLAGDGLAADVLERVLDHLAAPELTTSEAILVPFARETVWYQPARVQRRSLDIRQRLGTAELLHFIGIAALANALCRIGVVASAIAPDTAGRDRGPESA